MYYNDCLGIDVSERLEKHIVQRDVNKMQTPQK